jgi:heptaprenyl diphosphate synthase
MQTKRLTLLAVLLAVSIVLSIVESFIPVFVPGVKLGLANVVTLIVMYIYGARDAFLVLILRILLVALLRGTIFNVTFYLSLSGGMMAFVLMLLFFKFRVFSTIGVSIMGAFGHSVGQIATAIFLIERTELIFYFPYILVLSVITGVFTGVIANRALRIVRKAI